MTTGSRSNVYFYRKAYEKVGRLMYRATAAQEGMLEESTRSLVDPRTQFAIELMIKSDTPES